MPSRISTLSLNDAVDEVRCFTRLQHHAVFHLSHLLFFSDWRRIVSSKFFEAQVSSVSTEELVLPCHARCVLYRSLLQQTQAYVILFIYRVGIIENPSCSVCGHPTQDTVHLILYCPAVHSLRRSLFGNSFSLYDIWFRPWGVARLL